MCYSIWKHCDVLVFPTKIEMKSSSMCDRKVDVSIIFLQNSYGRL